MTTPPSPTSPPRRERYTMPLFVKQALETHRVMALYDARPPYQRNDYLMWIHHAVHKETKIKRLNQLISELKAGDVYMKMKWHSAS